MTGNYSDAVVIEAEGARVALITCLECGAALVLDDRDTESPVPRHDRFHDWQRRLASLLAAAGHVLGGAPLIPEYMGGRKP